MVHRIAENRNVWLSAAQIPRKRRGCLLYTSPLTDFRRGNPKWRSAFAKLKLEAEKAKIRVSNDESAPIHIDFLCNDDRNEPVEFDFELRRVDVEALMAPLVLRSLNICRKVLLEKRLAPGNIEKLLLVGGPTQAPYLRQLLADGANLSLIHI